MIQLMERTLCALCLSSSAKYKKRPAFALFSEGQVLRRLSYAQFGVRARQIGLLLKQMGVEKGGRVLLFSENSPEWPVAYFGIAFAEAVSVPVLTGFSGEEIQQISRHSGVSVALLSRAMADRFERCKFPQIPLIFIDSYMDGSAPEITVCIEGIEKQMPLPSGEDSLTLTQSKEDDLATIIYTSGTQGSSKGVMLSGANLISSALTSMVFQKLLPSDRFLSTLPLAHSYECGLGLLAPLICGASVTYLDRPPSPSVLQPALREVRPTAMFVVPLLIEKIYNNAIAPKLRSNWLYKFSLTRPLAIRVAGKKLISALGGRLRVMGIGGAPLSPVVEEFLYRARFPYTIGYGLTETAPLVAGKYTLRYPNTEGLCAARGVSIRIAECAADVNQDEGEIQVRGPNVMLGYYKDSERSAEALTADGWLRTGDLGRLDEKGRLHIRGRLKALILGPSGENIYPEEIEGILGTSQIVEDALVYSGNRGELVAMVRLNDTAQNSAGGNENVLEELRAWVNKKLSTFSRLSRIEIRKEPFEKTPTMKIKRYLYGSLPAGQ